MSMLVRLTVKQRQNRVYVSKTESNKDRTVSMLVRLTVKQRQNREYVSKTDSQTKTEPCVC